MKRNWDIEDYERAIEIAKNWRRKEKPTEKPVTPKPSPYSNFIEELQAKRQKIEPEEDISEEILETQRRKYRKRKSEQDKERQQQLNPFNISEEDRKITPNPIYAMNIADELRKKWGKKKKKNGDADEENLGESEIPKKPGKISIPPEIANLFASSRKMKGEGKLRRRRRKSNRPSMKGSPLMKKKMAYVRSFIRKRK